MSDNLYHKMLFKWHAIVRSIQYDIAVFRYVIASTLCLIIASTMNFSLSQLAPMMALLFIGKNLPPLTIKKSIVIILAMFVIGQFSVFVGHYTIHYPIVILSLLGLMLFWAYKLTSIPQPIRLLFIILMVITSYACLTNSAAGEAVMHALLLNISLALSVVSAMFLLLPDQPYEKPTIIDTPSPETHNPDSSTAMIQLIVVFPVILLFYIFNINVGITSLIFVIILSFDPLISQSNKTTALLLANMLGGIFAVLAYNILTVAPSYLMYILVSLCGAFYFGISSYSNKKAAPVYHIAFKTFLIILGLVTTSTNSANSELMSRIIQIAIAILYVTLAFKTINYFKRKKHA